MDNMESLHEGMIEISDSLRGDMDKVAKRATRELNKLFKELKLPVYYDLKKDGSVYKASSEWIIASEFMDTLLASPLLWELKISGPTKYKNNSRPFKEVK
jgi:hypothetical protein